MALAQNLNRTVLVAIPAFFGDEEARACTLVNVEAAGLWLSCEELNDRLGPVHELSAAWTAPVTGFFPFSQILYLVDLSQFAVLARGPGRPTPPRAAAPTARRDARREPARREGRVKKKDSKSRR
jgi:hypothetical protein